MFLIKRIDIKFPKDTVFPMLPADMHLQNSPFYLWKNFSSSIAEDWVLGVIPAPPLLHLIPLSSSFVFCLNKIHSESENLAGNNQNYGFLLNNICVCYLDPMKYTLYTLLGSKPPHCLPMHNAIINNPHIRASMSIENQFTQCYTCIIRYYYCGFLRGVDPVEFW